MREKAIGTLKTIIIFIILFFAFWVSATKIALISTAPELNDLSNQVLASMAEDNEIEFVERAKIELVLKEQQLSASGLSGINCVGLNKTIHADLFAVITARISRREVKPAGLIIYNARNGFRLANVSLSGKDTVKDIAKRLRQASELNKSPDKQTLISIVAVRNAGVPKRFKYMIAFTAAELERRLGNIPNVIVLERDYLDNVNRERDITGQIFKLAPSAHLLRLEFIPTDSFKKVALTIRRTNISGKEQDRYTVNDAFNSPDSTINSIITEFEKQLHLKSTKILKGKSSAKSRRAEARRFYYEYLFLLRLGDYKAARRKLQTVIALSPNSPKYRLAMLSLLYKSIIKQPSRRNFNFKKLFSKAEETFQICDEVHQDFPEYKKRIYLTGSGGGILVRMISVWRYAAPDEQKIMVEFMDKIRPKIQNELRRHYKFNLDDGINSVRELEEYSKYLFISCPFYYYFDKKKHINEFLARGVEILKLSTDFFNKNQQLIPEDIDRQYEIIAHNFGFPRFTNSTKYFVIKAKDYIETAKKHPFKAAKCIAYALELCRKTALSNYNAAIFRKNIQEYCHAINALQISHVPKDTRSDRSCSGYEYFLRANRQHSLLKVAKQITVAKLQTGVPFEKLLQAITLEKDIDLFARKVMTVIPEFKKLRPQIFSDRKLCYYPDIFANRLYYGTRQNNKNCRKALDLLMDRTKITKLLSLKQLLPLSNDIEYTQINRSLWHNGAIYLLVRNRIKGNSSTTLNLIKLNPTTGIAKEINRISGLSGYTYSRDIHISLSSKYAIVGLKDSLFLLPLNGSPLSKLKDFPGQTVQAATMLNSRIYIFTGRTHKRKGYSQENLIISCLLNGSDRKIHMSTLREDKQNILDRNPSVINAAFTDIPRKRILFSIDQPSKMKGLWEFYPESGKFNRLLASLGVFSRTSKIGNNVFFASRTAYYSFDCRNDNIQKQLIIHYNKKDETAKFKTVIPRTSKSYRGLASLFLIQDKRQCMVSESRLLIFPPGKLEQSPFIFLSSGKELTQPSRYRQSEIYMTPFMISNLFPHPDGKSVIVVGQKNIYKVTLKSMGVEQVASAVSRKK